MMRVGLEGITHGYAHPSQVTGQGTGKGPAVLHDITLDIDPGSFVVVVGPSGCGKSTLLRLLAGLESPHAGRVIFGGEDVTMLPARQRNVAMVFQSYALYPHLSVRGNLELALRMARLDAVERNKRVARVADFLELTPVLDRRPAALSGGQRQRVAMGRALVRRPGVFLFDEPLSNLDADLRQRLRNQIKALHAEFPATKVYVTHDQVEAMTLADVVIVLKEGTIQQVGSPAEIYAAPANLFVAQFFGWPAINLLQPSEEVRSRPQGGAGPLEPLVRCLRSGAWVAGIRPEDVVLGPPAGAGALAGDGTTLVGTIEDTEHLGATSIVQVGTCLGRLGVLVPRAALVPLHALRRSEEILVTLPVNRIHWFERDSGLRSEGPMALDKLH